METSNEMKAGIEVTDLQRRGPGSPLTQAIVDATRALVANGGKIEWEDLPDRCVRRYIFTGPPELIRPVIAAFMAFIMANP